MTEGIRIEVPEAASDKDEHEFVLPSGRKATMRPGKGRDVRLSMMAVGQPFDAGKYLFAMIARRTKIDGKTVTMEAIDDLPEDDVDTLMAEAQKGAPFGGGGLITPVVLGEMVQAGFAPRDLDEMTLDDITSWRAVMAAYGDAVDRARARR